MFNVRDWYWEIGDQIWGSKANALVESDDADYQAFLTKNVPTKIGSVQAAIGVVIEQTGLLDSSDVTMTRTTEAVALGLNEWTNADVVAFVNYRRALRAIVSGTDTTSTSIPSKPVYPAGT